MATSLGWQNDIDWVFEKHFDDIAGEIDTIVRKQGLDDTEVMRYVGDWDFQEFYEQWITEGE